VVVLIKRKTLKIITMSIWKYKNYLEPKIKKENQLSLNEGNTPYENCPALQKLLELERVFIKREDLNPTGSFKDRSLAFQLSVYKQKGEKNFIISSSGNAAISAISYSQLFNTKIHVFVSKFIQKDKLNRLLAKVGIKGFNKEALQTEEAIEVRKGNVMLHFSKRAKSDSFKFEKKSKFKNLRGSKDDLAIEGFKTLGFELQEQAAEADSVFIPCSSGTSAMGIYKGYTERKTKCPQIHVVQNSRINPIASFFDKEFLTSKSSLASAIVDRVAHRKNEVIKAIQDTGGSGWVVSDNEINTAKALMKLHCDIEISFDAALSLAGLIKALASGYNVKRPILIISGK
jgi:threonine synthase